MLEFDRKLSCAPCCGKCCCYEEVRAYTYPDQELLGSVKERFWCCIPKFEILDHQGTEIFHLHQRTCCFGWCVRGTWVTSPFLVYRPDLDADDPTAKILPPQHNNTWTHNEDDAGKMDTFQIQWKHLQGGKDPENSEKALLLMTTLLINQVFYNTPHMTRGEEGEKRNV